MLEGGPAQVADKDTPGLPASRNNGRHALGNRCRVASHQGGSRVVPARAEVVLPYARARGRIGDAEVGRQ